jgi:hypothetical protein
MHRIFFYRIMPSMRSSHLLFIAAVVPVTVLAATFSQNTYVDVHDSSPNTAGIVLLTREGVVDGYGDNRFGPSRRVNRAEFLKMAMASTGDATDFSPETCFPDVRAQDWFSPFICAAKDRGIVSGRGGAEVPASERLFVPADPVTYGEALKMLTGLYGYDIPSSTSADWAEPYYLAAAEHNVDLPMTIQLDLPLTRGLAARLGASFLAESKGMLDEFRLAESGNGPLPAFGSISSSISSSSSSVSSASSVSSVSSSSSSVAARPLYTLPSVSHFLVVGKTSDAIADGIIRINGEAGYVSAVEVKLFNEVRSIESLELTTQTGQVLATHKRRVTSDTTDYKLTFEVQMTNESQPKIPADTDIRVVLRAVVRSAEASGFSDELLHMRLFSVTLRGATTNTVFNIPIAAPFPKHQTSFGRITGVSRLSPATGPLQSATGVVLGSFALSGSAIPGRNLAITNLIFSLYRTGPVTLSNIRLMKSGASASMPCSLAADGLSTTCGSIDGSIGSLPPLTPLHLTLTGDVSFPPGTTSASVEAWLDQPGSPEALGSVQWTDQAGMFKWVEGVAPLAHGTRLQ